MSSFDRFQRPLPGLSGHDRALLFDALPADWQKAMWARLKEQIQDRRFLDGLVEFRSRKPRKAERRRHKVTKLAVPLEDPLTGIDAEIYLEAFGSEVFPGGRARCPHRDHEDLNPSVSFRGSVWFCHSQCGEGGGIYEAASAVSGIGTRGPDFLELRQWVAARLFHLVSS